MTKGAFRSRNRGDTWERLALPDDDTDLWSLTIHPADPRIIYAGYGPTGVFIFSNGDVATYDIYPDNPGVPACKYVKGSARNAEGVFINDRGLGGNGSSNGSNYVRGGNGSFTVLTQSYTIACVYGEDEEGRISLGHCEIMLP